MSEFTVTSMVDVHWQFAVPASSVAVVGCGLPDVPTDIVGLASVVFVIIRPVVPAVHKYVYDASPPETLPDTVPLPEAQ